MSKVTVVGAGAAGLMAALELESAGHDVAVVEARDRTGGRVHTVRFEDGSWANAGAEWVNSTDVIVHELRERFDLELQPRAGFEALVVDGAIVDADAEFDPLIDELDRLVTTLGDRDRPWDDPVARVLDESSVADWLGTLDGVEPRVLRRFATDLRAQYMTDVDLLSLAAVVLVTAHTRGDRYARFTHGTADLTDAMAAAVRGPIALGDPVIGVVDDGSSVTVTTVRGTHESDALVLAVPLPALMGIGFSPSVEFPWIGQGRGGKLLVSCGNRPWTDYRPTARTDFPGEFVYENASHQPGMGGVLAAYSVDVIDDDTVLRAFDTWFPSLTRAQAVPTRAWWSLESYSGTTYSAPQPGFLDALCAMREPFGPMWLAGEHTEMMSGFVESALVSGRRVAGLIDGAMRRGGADTR